MLNEILKRSNYFLGLGENDIKTIAAVVKKGVRIFQLSSGGKEHLLHIFGVNDVFGEAEAFGLGIFQD